MSGDGEVELSALGHDGPVLRRGQVVEVSVPERGWEAQPMRVDTVKPGPHGTVRAVLWPVEPMERREEMDTYELRTWVALARRSNSYVSEDGVPWEWLSREPEDWRRDPGFGDERGEQRDQYWKVPTSCAPENYTSDCVVRVRCRWGAVDCWDQEPVPEGDDPEWPAYEPPERQLEGEHVVAVRAAKDALGRPTWHVQTVTDVVDHPALRRYWRASCKGCGHKRHEHGMQGCVADVTRIRDGVKARDCCTCMQKRTGQQFEYRPAGGEGEDEQGGGQ